MTLSRRGKTSGGNKRSATKVKRDVRHSVSPKLLELLVCPVTGGALRYDSERGELISDKACLAYPIRDGVPIMLADEARVIK